MTSQKQKEKALKDDKKDLIDTESDSLFDDSVTDPRAGPKARHKKKIKPVRSMYSDSEEFDFKETESEFDSSKEGYFEDETVTAEPEADVPSASDDVREVNNKTASEKKKIHSKERKQQGNKELPEDRIQNEKKPVRKDGDDREKQKIEYRKHLKEKAREKRDARKLESQTETSGNSASFHSNRSEELSSTKDEYLTDEGFLDDSEASPFKAAPLSDRSSEDEHEVSITRKMNNVHQKSNTSISEMGDMQTDPGITQKNKNITQLGNTGEKVTSSKKGSTQKSNNHTQMGNTQLGMNVKQKGNSITPKSNTSTKDEQVSLTILSENRNKKNVSQPNMNIVGKAGSTSLSAVSYSTGKARSVVSKATGEKDDNAGADAFSVVEQAGERAVHYGFYTAEELLRSSARSTYQTSEYVTDSMFETTKKTASKAEADKAAYRRKLRKKRAQIRRKARKAEKAGKSAARKAAEETVNVAKFIGKIILARGKIIIGVVIAILVIIIFGGQMSGSTINIMTEVASVMSMATYQSSPQMIDQADLDMSYRELMLRAEIDEIEDDYPDYEEYSYTLGSIGHNPYTLINYLHAQFGQINSEAMAYIEVLFNEMYQLKLTPKEETRYRLVPKPEEEDDDEEEDDSEDEESEDESDDEEDSGESSEDDEEEDEDDEEPEYILEEYTVSILKVELITRSLEDIVSQRLEGDATRKAIYNILNISHGLVQFVGSPTLTSWSVESYYGYRRNPLGDYPELHRGLDIAMPVGSSVHSAISGFVKEIASDPLYGDYIVIEDETGTTVKYANMGHITAIVESRVHKGETIGYSGSGGSEPPCLHMELLVNGSYYNPLFYTENPQPSTD